MSKKNQSPSPDIPCSPEEKTSSTGGQYDHMPPASSYSGRKGGPTTPSKAIGNQGTGPNSQGTAMGNEKYPFLPNKPK